MTAVVSRERAKATCLTGAAGVLMLAVAFVMMVVAAPGHVHGPAKPSVAQLTADVGHLHQRTHEIPYLGVGRPAALSGYPAVGAARAPRSTSTERDPTVTRSPACRGASAEPASAGL
jgi:hypothetical protein